MKKELCCEILCMGVRRGGKEGALSCPPPPWPDKIVFFTFLMKIVPYSILLPVGVSLDK